MLMPARKKLHELKLTRKIQRTAQGNYIVAIPKRLADMRNVEHSQEVEWSVTKDGKIQVQI